MAAPLTAHLTELNAVNKILSSIGEDSISDITDADSLADAASALTKLREVSRQVQASGWGCNTNRGDTLTINGSSEFAVPVNTLKVDTTEEDTWREVSMRLNDAATRYVLFDHDNNSLTWDTATTLKVDIVYYKPFNELTPSLQHYIQFRAGHEFQKSAFGSVRLFEFTAEDVQIALAEAEAEESENEDNNILRQSNSALDISRRRNSLWGR
jgi:hypothetical protein